MVDVVESRCSLVGEKSASVLSFWHLQNGQNHFLAMNIDGNGTHSGVCLRYSVPPAFCEIAECYP